MQNVAETAAFIPGGSAIRGTFLGVLIIRESHNLGVQIRGPYFGKLPHYMLQYRRHSYPSIHKLEGTSNLIPVSESRWSA